MGALIGSSTVNSKAGRTVVRSVTLTASTGDDAEIKLYDYQMSDGDPKIIARALNGETVNIHFNGIEFPGGVLVVPDANTQNYLVEYGE